MAHELGFTPAILSAGVTRKYRVIPKRGDRVGEPSNIAAVYQQATTSTLKATSRIVTR